MPRRDHQDFRNYDKEARNLIKDLRSDELYRLLEIVVEQQKRRCTDERLKELEAVQKAIFSVPKLDMSRLKKIVNGYQSEMAAGARAHDGNTRVNRKHV